MSGTIVFLSTYQGESDFEYIHRTQSVSRIKYSQIRKLSKGDDIRSAFARYRAEKRQQMKSYCIKNKLTPPQFWQLVKNK